MGSQGTTQLAAATKHLMGNHPGIIRAIALDFTSSNASGVITIKEESSSGATIFAYTGDTDTTNAATGELLVPCTDGLNVSNSTIADTMGLFFAKGLYLAYTSATAGDTVKVTLLIEADVTYHKQTVTVATGATTANGDYYHGGPGILRAIRVTTNHGTAGGDLTLLVDADARGTAPAGATVFTATDLGTSSITSAAGTGCAAAVLVGGVDEAGGAVTSPPGGGIPFLHSIRLHMAQYVAADNVTLEYWITS
jgi:hypothetical protein